MGWALKIDFDHNGAHTVQNCKLIRFFVNNRVNSINFNATILNFFKNFDHTFSHVFYLVTCFLRIFVAMPVISCIKDTFSNWRALWKSTRTGQILKNPSVCKEHCWTNYVPHCRSEKDTIIPLQSVAAVCNFSSPLCMNCCDCKVP